MVTHWKTVSIAKPMLSKEVMPKLGPSHFSKLKKMNSFESTWGKNYQQFCRDYQGNLYTGGRLLYRLCSYPPTLELAIGKLEYNWKIISPRSKQPANRAVVA